MTARLTGKTSIFGLVTVYIQESFGNWEANETEQIRNIVTKAQRLVRILMKVAYMIILFCLDTTKSVVVPTLQSPQYYNCVRRRIWLVSCDLVGVLAQTNFPFIRYIDRLSILAPFWSVNKNGGGSWGCREKKENATSRKRLVLIRVKIMPLSRPNSALFSYWLPLTPTIQSLSPLF